MSTTKIEIQAKALAAILKANGLLKTGSQEIEHTTTTAQNNLGAEQQQEIKENIEGTIASTPAAENNDKAKVDTPPNNQDLNKEPAAAMSATGTTVQTMHQDGSPATLEKSAADYKQQLAGILALQRKQGELKKQAAEQYANDFRTGTEVMQKLATLTEKSTEAERKAVEEELVKLAATNPVFTICRNRILMFKQAEDAAALAAAQGIPIEEAADQMDAAAAKDPSILQSAEDEANGEAVAELANAEGAANELMAGIQELADNASAATGQPVSPDQIMDAMDDVEAQAEALGVPPAALIQAAAMEMGGGGAEVTEQDLATAEQLLQQAEEQGVSPDEFVQMAAEKLAGGGGEPQAAAEPPAEPAAPEEPAAEPPAEPAAPAEEKKEDKPADGEGEKKEATVQMTPRAAYVYGLLHPEKKTNKQ